MTATTRLSILLLLLPIFLTGCTALSALGEASQPLEIYELRTPVIRQAAARRNVELVVEEPVASGSLSTERIMIRPAPLQAQYLPRVRWADTAPVMLQTLMVRSLADAGALNSVGRRPIGTVGDYAVLSELTDFQAETSEGARAVVRVRLILRLVREGESRVVATRTFAVVENTEGTDADGIVAAFDLAVSRLLAEAVPWIIARTG